MHKNSMHTLMLIVCIWYYFQLYVILKFLGISTIDGSYELRISKPIEGKYLKANKLHLHTQILYKISLFEIVFK